MDWIHIEKKWNEMTRRLQRTEPPALPEESLPDDAPGPDVRGGPVQKTDAPPRTAA